MPSTARTVRVFIGTYTQTTSKGIYVYDVDTDSGVMEYVSHVGGITNPSFLVLTPDARFLYAVGETGDPHGGVFAYAVDASGALTPLNSQSSGGLRSLLHRRAPQRQGRPRGQLRRRFRILLSRERRRLPGRGGVG